MTSKHFSERIRQLEHEGAKLIAATHSLSDSLHLEDDSKQEHSKFKASSGVISSQLSALTDISAEQKTIENLRKNLDEQCKETNRLHREMFNTSSSSFREPTRPSTLANLEIPITTDYSVTRPRHCTTDFSLSNTGNNIQLRESQKEVTELRSKVKEALSISDQQKTHFRENIQDLHAQLNSVVSERDSLLHKSKREMNEKELTIEKFHETASQLERANRVQEETLIELNEKLEHQQKDQYMVDSAVSQIRGLLQVRETRRRHPFYENDPINKQSVTVLVHSIDKCFQDLDYEVAQKQDKIDQLMLEVDDVKVCAERKEDKLTLDQERRFAKLQDEHDRAVLKLTEQCSNYKDQAILLQDKVNILEKQLEQQMKVREDHIKDLETKMYTLRQEHDTEKKEWMSKKYSMEMALDESQKDLALTKGEKDASIRTGAQIESRFADMQSLLEKLNSELTEEREKNRHIQEKETHARAAQERLQIQLKHKDQVLSDLEQRVKVVKQDADAQIQSAISNMEKEGRAYIEKEISSLKTQVEALTDRCHKLQLELEVTKSDHRNLQERYKESKDNLDKVTSQLEQATAKKESLNTLLNEKLNDIERVTHEKDYYFKLIDERNQEISALNALKEKFKIQLEEREKNFMTLQQQNDKITELMNEKTKSSSELRLERDNFHQQYNDKVLETDEALKLRDQLTKKIKLKDKKIQEFEEENTRLSQELGERKTEAGTLSRQKEKLYEELKSSRYDVAKLEQDKQTLEKQLQMKEGELSKELTKLSKKLKSAEHDMKLAKKTLRTREEVDGKAVKVAGKMQKEVTEKRGQIDTLQTRIRWLEECLDAAIKDKTVLQEENEKLTTSIFKLGKQSDRLSQELQNNLTKNKTLREKIVNLEGALEKAAIKNAAVQAEIEEQQQEIARLQLKHQLQLKEMNRNGNIKNFYNPVEQSKVYQITDTAKLTSISQSVKGTTPHLTIKSLETDEKPVRDKPNKVKSSPQSDEEGVGHELRHLLDEMRTLIQGQQKHKPITSKYHSNDSSVFSDSELVPRSYHRSKSSKDRHQHKSHGKMKERQRSGSPVADLLISSDLQNGTQSDTMLSPVSLDETRDNYFSYKKPLKISTVQHSIPLTSDSKDVCRRLEKKIENLSKMGNHLQHENKQMAKVMKDQDKKLKKVRSQMVK